MTHEHLIHIKREENDESNRFLCESLRNTNTKHLLVSISGSNFRAPLFYFQLPAIQKHILNLFIFSGRWCKNVRYLSHFQKHRQSTPFLNFFFSSFHFRLCVCVCFFIQLFHSSSNYCYFRQMTFFSVFYLYLKH